MFLEPEPTPYDLRWRMFGIPVRVHPFFWVLAALLGWNQIALGLEFVLLWIAAVFVSILIHEFGHALLMHVFGLGASVVLYSFGGLAIPERAYRSRGQHILIALAGPLAGFAFFGAILASDLLFPWAETSIYTKIIFTNLIFINLFWNLLNLVPIFPLDGGQISREVAGMVSRLNGDRFAFGLSMLIAGILAAHGLMTYFMKQPLLPFLPIGGLWMGILFAMLAFQNYQLYQYAGNRRSGWDDDDGVPWRR